VCFGHPTLISCRRPQETGPGVGGCSAGGLPRQQGDGACALRQAGAAANPAEQMVLGGQGLFWQCQHAPSMRGVVVCAAAC